MSRPVTIVSCDVVGHSSADETDQVARVEAINAIVDAHLGEDVVWASGGDGGHVLFWQDDWREPALGLVRALRSWSLDASVPLRITCHRGTARRVVGAGGAVQPVGAAINEAGALLDRVDDGITVTDAFRLAVGADAGVEFHDPVRLLGNDGRLHPVHLMSIGPLRSSWGTSLESDHRGLRRAVAHGSSWDILYHAKRIWQASSHDPAVKRCVEEAVEPPKLTFTDRRGREVLNPFLGQSDRDELVEMLRLGKLVERRRGEFICRYGDAGDSLFVILRGEVGVFNSEGEGAVEALHTHRRGEIVGELAYALARKRTADVVAMTDVALLSFRYDDVHLLSNAPVGSVAARNVASFINYRALQHIADNAPYLLGPDRDGPLSAGRRGWDETLASLRSRVELITLRRLPVQLSIEDVEAPKPKGIYVLARGTLEAGGRLFRGSDFPVLWVNVPRFPTERSTRYAVRSRMVKVLWIGAKGIDELDPDQKKALHEALTATVAEPSRTGSTLNRVETNTGTVVQIDRVLGDLHVHPAPEPHD
ncbi:Cyclic nucleotide-binding domain-containing protein [Lentzea fradiae]|uniref:Cyclic nucleotide-binding domain-containing protein n=1 Tax=Lentzea fradiae TaxID=200378 RepID=A0A1G8DRS6_9PSEU|nr:cyclic nucleotide-binding domain-containing protein [Lentzea fradiae]SDH60251.1 Cyclic nucleotide-binding domain-containing protein [Lentzea fradiae]